MTTLTDFLLRRIAEDEAVARRKEDDLVDAVGADMHFGEEWARDERRNRRALAECKARRRIVEALVDAEDAVGQYDPDDPNNPPSYWQEWGNRHALRLAVELLALPYADSPEYDERWRP